MIARLGRFYHYYHFWVLKDALGIESVRDKGSGE
jgi:hypothetical protein